MESKLLGGIVSAVLGGIIGGLSGLGLLAVLTEISDKPKHNRPQPEPPAVVVSVPTQAFICPHCRRVVFPEDFNKPWRPPTGSAPTGKVGSVGKK